MSNRHRRLKPAALLLIACGLTFGGCDIVGRISGAYRGPSPTQEAITDETVIIRSLEPGPEGAFGFIADRVRYLDAGKPHDVNRVVRVRTPLDIAEQAAALNLTVGERVTISTRFAYIGDASDLTEVPDWPGHDFREYPIGVHLLTEISR
jgi:hypothetical protein